MKRIKEQQEYILPGLRSCPGCARVLANRHILKILGKNTVEIIAASCDSIIPSAFPQSNLKIPAIHSLFPATDAIAAGVRAGFKTQGIENIIVMPATGDGGTYDIGLQALSAAAERNENLLHICYDNEAYMNTGIQRSSATPQKARTTTTPKDAPKSEFKKDIMKIMAAHKIPYCATASIAFPEDLSNKIKKAKKTKGFRFILVSCPCPPGWGFEPELSVKIARLATATRIWPLYEISNGRNYTINEMPKKIPVKEYLEMQGRFSHLTEKDKIQIQNETEKDWQYLQKTAKIK